MEGGGAQSLTLVMKPAAHTLRVLKLSLTSLPYRAFTPLRTLSDSEWPWIPCHNVDAFPSLLFRVLFGTEKIKGNTLNTPATLTLHISDILLRAL